MKLCALSDLHGNLISNIDPCDLVLICGDIVPLKMQNNPGQSKYWFLNKFKSWANNLPCKKVIFIAGNHDWFIYFNEDFIKSIFPENEKVTFLNDSITVFNGKTIYGTPRCKIFFNWAFNETDEDLETYFQKIPENVDILLSHDSPNINEIGMIHEGNRAGIECGNDVLTKYILLKRPKYVLSGHIHSGNHNLTECEEIKLSNVSILNELYDVAYEPFYFEL